MKRIAIDMDEVMADFNSKHLSLYNQDHNDQVTLEDLRNGRLADLRPHLAQQIIDYLRDPLFYRNLGVIKDSQEVIRALCAQYVPPLSSVLTGV